MKQLRTVCLLALMATVGTAAAQDAGFDPDAFAKELNTAIKAKRGEGVTVSGDPRASGFVKSVDWAREMTSQPPQFGVVVLDKNKKPIDVLGGTAPIVVVGSGIDIPGYQLPAGGSFKTIGAAEWTRTISEIANQAEPPAPSEDIEKAVTVVADATDYIADKLCSRRSHPTKIVFHLTAGFDLVFTGETGSQVEWDLEVVCARMAK